MGMTIRRPATAISDAPAGEGAGELASVVSWYTFMVEKLGAAGAMLQGACSAQLVPSSDLAM